MLRHRDGSTQSVRYATTRDAIAPSLRRSRRVSFALSSKSPSPRRQPQVPPSVSSGPCHVCGRQMPVKEEGGACEEEGCGEIVCYGCHTEGDDFWCTEHRRSAENRTPAIRRL